MKRLVKSQSRVLCGVCGGIGEYLNIDPTIIRLLWILFCFCGGAGIIAYIIAAIIIPEVQDAFFNNTYFSVTYIPAWIGV